MDLAPRPFLNAGARERELLETHIKNARRTSKARRSRGAFLKLIQMLSMRHDLAAERGARCAESDAPGVPPMSYPMIAEQIRKELGRKPEQLFRALDQTAFAAASLGQSASREAEGRPRCSDKSAISGRLRAPVDLWDLKN